MDEKKDPVVGDLDSSPLCNVSCNCHFLDIMPIEQNAQKNLSLDFHMQRKVDIKMKIKQCDKLNKTIKEKGPYKWNRYLQCNKTLRVFYVRHMQRH